VELLEPPEVVELPEPPVVVELPEPPVVVELPLPPVVELPVVVVPLPVFVGLSERSAWQCITYRCRSACDLV